MYRLLFTVCILLPFVLHSQLPNRPVQVLPVISHTYYDLQYSEPHEQPLWVYYTLCRADLQGKAKRKNKFKEDPKVTTGSARDIDYKRMGYDRGHLCPAADMVRSRQAMDETFYYSNISPQIPDFNRGVWKQLEEQVRTWATEYDSLYIATGPLFEENINIIGVDRVVVPGYYYKVIYAPAPQKMMAFILPHRAIANDSLPAFIRSVDEVEDRTGLDFYAELPDSLENMLEKSITKWAFYPQK